MPPPLVDDLSPALRTILKGRTESMLLSLIKKNKDTRYFSESPVFLDFHTALQDLRKEGDSEDRDDALIESYYSTIPLTTYDSYEPFVKRFLESNCLEKDVQNMFAPGLPHGIAKTSSTSSAKAKYIALYNYKPVTAPPKSTSGKIYRPFSFKYHQLIDVQNDKGDTIMKFPVAAVSAIKARVRQGLDVDQDHLNIKLASPYTSPNAVGFITKYPSFLSMHILFALAERELETITVYFSTAMLDMILYMEQEWDTLVASIGSGTLPDWEGIDHVREYLEPHFPPRPERAAELLAIGKATEQPGWFGKVWPILRTVFVVGSGVFAGAIPKIKHYIGPDVELHSQGYFASEASVGLAYDPPKNMNLYKLLLNEFFEFLDVTNEGTASGLLCPWQVNVGKMYEVVVTANKGLWRYRIGDIVEIAGFDPNDGTPVVRFVERRNLAARLASVMLSESQITSAILAVQDTLGLIGEFTTVIDDNKYLGYFVEIQGDLDPKADEAPARLMAEFVRQNERFRPVFESKRLEPFTIRILKSGTFAEYRRWKSDVNKSGLGQVKVPVVLWDNTAREWIFQRVERELGSGSVPSESKH